jgi:hypothetical protein
VQTFAGHSSLQVTVDRYGHLFKSDDHKKGMDAVAADMFGWVRSQHVVQCSVFVVAHNRVKVGCR